ncbi:MAG TPA: hypothetical protein VH913_14110 [Hyphomicrobiaceae bacterium]|jgi:hypothetical protein
MATAPTPLKPKTASQPAEPMNGAPTPHAPPKRLREGAIQVLEHYNAIWAAVAPNDHTLADAMRPEYCGLRFERMRPFDEIWIRHASGDWLLKLLVLKIDPITKAVFSVPLPGYPLDLKGARLAEADLSQARIDQVEAGWRVLLGNDILADGLPDEAAASAWLAKKRAGVE